jgi:hypothetical protein
MLSIDWANIFFLIVVFALIVFAIRTEDNGLRIGAHIIVFVTLLSILTPMFAVLYGVLAGVHIVGESEK